DLKVAPPAELVLQEDASFNVRESNWEMVQPRVRANPIGVGLGSTGVWGQRFSPNSFWADFPPDSGYVRVAVEMGWIGLILLMLILGTAMKVGIASYFRIKNEQLKEIYLVLLSVFIAFIALNYPQEAITTPPFIFLFLFILAMIHVIPELDRRLQQEKKP
ncbi:MAG: O-antigen ligase domain-containing protein, partial [Cyclonatronaceae bacterium]